MVNKRKLPPITLRNFGVSTFYFSLFCSGCFMLASLEKAQVPVGWRDAQTFTTKTQPTPLKPLYSAGALLSLLICGCHLRTKFNGIALVDLETLSADTGEAFEVLVKHGLSIGGEWIGEGLRLSLDAGKDMGQSLTQLAISAAPLTIRTAVEQMQSDKSWFEKFLKAPHNRVAGRTRSGKRFIASQLLIDFVQRYPRGQVIVCDKDFGKDGNDWMGLPLEMVHSDLAAIDAAVRTVYEVLVSRAKIWETAARERRTLTPIEQAEVSNPILLVVDELDSTNDDFKDLKNDKFIYHLKQLLKRGGGADSGYKIKVLLIGQSLSVGTKNTSGSGIDLALTDQMATCLTVGLGQLNTEQLSKLKSEVGDDLAHRALSLTSKGIRAAVVQLEGTSQVVAIPDLSHLETFRFAQIDPNEFWWQSVWTPETQAWLKGLARSHAKGEIPSPLKGEIAQRFGVKIRSDDARYTNFVKPEWENLLTEIKEKNK